MVDAAKKSAISLLLPTLTKLLTQPLSLSLYSCIHFPTKLSALPPRTAAPTSARKVFLRNPRILLRHISTLVTLRVSIFAEIPLTPVSPPERNDGH